mmetsp:Transcript_14330/g.31284  ORF Transcript_14330/g.31284 Transcript_14330/m.31284 type:complete len:271 (-) Transcript_14330:76-888(-)
MQLALGIDGLDDALMMAQNLQKKTEDKKKKLKKSGGGKKSSKSTKSSLSRSSSSSSKPKQIKKRTSKIPSETDHADAVSTISGISNVSDGSKGATPSVVSVTSAASSPESARKTTRNTLFQQSMMVDQTWDHIKNIKNYKEFVGEQIVLRMMEIDPKKTARQDLGITSLRSVRFDSVCQTLLVVVDVLVSLVGPDMEEFQEELQDIGQQCKKEGISIPLLGEAVGGALQIVLKEHQPEEDGSGDGFVMTEEHVEAWKVVFANVAEKMADC